MRDFDGQCAFAVHDEIIQIWT